MSGKREFGDYQTPIEFTKKICDYLRFEKRLTPSIVIEPTCGIGNFLESSLSFNAASYYGIEINTEYCNYCRKRISDERVNIINSDFFTFNTKSLINDMSNVLVVGNPPWATNSMLSTFSSNNLPVKSNFKKLKGLDAITGKSNFDICESIILQLINEFRDTDTVIAMLCKTSVARNIFKELKRNSINFEYCDLLEFDAQKVFGINTSACALIIKLSINRCYTDNCNICSIDDSKRVKYSLSFINDRFYNNTYDNNYNFDGTCCFEWRQGVKHDCSKVMELSLNNDTFYNGKKEAVDIENNFLFPLVKSSMFKLPVINTFSKYVLVTQKKIRDRTDYIETIAPKTWNYLNNNIDAFNNRKSSIYRGAPPFSMFGVGDYSYSPYKVGVSGFYKKPLFSVLYSPDGKPVMTDDTSYFICFKNYDMAYVAMLLLNSIPVQTFLMSIAFLDAKRPYTKKVLERLSFKKMFAFIKFDELVKTEKRLNLNCYVTKQMYSEFKSLPAFKKSK